MTLEQTALNLIEKGYAVFPLAPKKKTPITEHGFRDASKDPDQIKKWWTEHPDANIGIACGEPSTHLIVIDVDNKHGHSGSESLNAWQKDHGLIPETMTIRTPNGGLHFYYRDKGQWNSPVNVLDGIDIRCNGSYVVGPGSVLDTGEYRIVNEADDKPHMINDSVRELLKLHGTRSDTGEQHEPTFKDDGQPVSEGGRNKFLSDKAGALVKKYPDWTEDQLQDAIRQINQERCIPPLDDSELRKTVFKSLSRWKAKRDAEPPEVKLTRKTFTDEEWKQIQADQTAEEIKETESQFPKPFSMASVWNNPPELAPVLIDGVLRVGHKMIITGPSKAGKSFAMIELAFAISEGMKWFGCRCKMGKVLYLNMEIDEPSFIRRVQSVYKKYGMNQGIHPENFEVWNLRGYAAPITKLAPLIVENAKGKGYLAIIIDPLYKVMAGDENSNSDTAEMLKGFDLIATETGASVIYSHHFAKGNGGDRSVIDRGSGAGVFARDPDAITSLAQIDYEDPIDPNVTAWKVEFVLREFAPKAPINLFFRYPVHEIDSKGILDDCDLVTTSSIMRKAKAKEAEKQNSLRSENIRHCAEVCRKSDEHGGFTTKDFMAEYEKYEPNKSRDTIERRLKAEGYIKDQTSKGLSGIWHHE